MDPAERLAAKEVKDLITLYEKAEREMLLEINRGLLKGNNVEYLKIMRQNCNTILGDLHSNSVTWADEAVPGIYNETLATVDEAVRLAGGRPAIGFGLIHEEAMKTLAQQMYGSFDELKIRIGRSVDDIYRTVAMENLTGAVSGYDTVKQAAKKIRADLAERGVTGFVDKAGHKWNMKTYSEMVAQTTTAQIHRDGTTNRLLEGGYDLVIISEHANPCPLCVEWQGMTLSLTGRSKDYPSLSEAMGAGLYHVRCKHTHSLSREDPNL